MISILILVKNEEKDLAGCLASVSWSDDVHVFDSYSSDKTIEIAMKHGTKVTQRKFDDYSSHRNAALSSLNYKYPWVFILDADERIPHSLSSLLKKIIVNVDDATSAFRFRRRDYWGETWLKYSQISPYYIRLVRLGKVHYVRKVNEVLKVQGRIEDISEHFNHYPFSKGMTHWLEKHNKYSSMEAVRWVEENEGREKFSLNKALFSKDFNVRRYHQKGFFYKLPARPILKWIYIIFVRFGFLDGKAGFTYATLQAIYEYFIILKSKELNDNPA